MYRPKSKNFDLEQLWREVKMVDLGVYPPRVKSVRLSQTRGLGSLLRDLGQQSGLGHKL